MRKKNREVLSESIRISKSTKKLLEDSKVFDRETFDDVIVRKVRFCNATP